MTGLTVAALLSLGWPVWATGVLIVLLGLNLWYCLSRYAWLSAPLSCIGLIIDAEGVKMLRRDGAQWPCVLSPDSLVTPYLVVLNVLPQDSRRMRSIVILPDSMEAEAFRQLRVWLKWGSQPAVPDGVSTVGTADGKVSG